MREEKEDKRMQVFDLEKYIGKNVHVTFFGGIEMSGRLKGYDQILNLVLEEARMVNIPGSEDAQIEHLYSSAPSTITCRGASICSIDLV